MSGPSVPPPRRRRWPWVVVSAALAGAALGASLGFGAKFDLPDVESLEDYTPPLNTRVLAADGTALASFGEQRRILLGYRDIPESFQQALLSVEDAGFYGHTGIDFRGIVRAAWHDLTTLSLEQGASTITQQLARSLFLHPEKTVRRKIQEAFLALEVERRYTKQEILTLYCNQVYMGHGFYGLEAASRLYFGKSAREIDLPEAALLAGVIQRPEGHTPLRNPERALQRRNYVLRRMHEEGYIDRETMREAQEADLGIAAREQPSALAPYYVEQVRRGLQARYGDDALYRAGFEVRTALDPRLQTLANHAVEAGLRELDRRQGWRGVQDRVPDGGSPENWASPEWRNGVRVGEVVEGVVLDASPRRARVRVGPYAGDLLGPDVAWTGRDRPDRILRAGDRVRVRVVAVDEGGEADLALEQQPEVEAALVAIDPATGAVRALVGGFSFDRSQFDRAIQARRQAGSAFKPIVYAAALAQGMTPSDRIVDRPTVFLDPDLFTPYQPENFGNKYLGRITLRQALEQSANIATVKLLDRVGAPAVIDLARRLGISTELQPFPSMALGAFEVSLLELTGAYATFANQGLRVEPHLVESVLARDGTTLERTRPRAVEALGPRAAFLMNHLLEGVVTDGTGRAAASLGRPLAGKTGTTDDSTDAWFVGYSPDLAVGVWVGFDVKRSLGRLETGSRAALPIWRAFMEGAYEGLPPVDFPVPAGIETEVVDRDTGLKANESAGCRDRLAESFLEGTAPTSYCSTGEHMLLGFPYTFHDYELDEQGRLVVPEEDLRLLLATEPSVRWDVGRNRLEATGHRGWVALPLRIVPGGGELSHPIPPEAAAAVDPAVAAQWVGKDGRPAKIHVLAR